MQTPATTFVMLRHLAETLVIAGAGGLLFGLNGLPAGWLSGSLLFVAIAAIAGRPMMVPAPMSRVIFVIIGITLGGAVTPETLKGMQDWPISIAVLAISISCATVTTMKYLRAVHGWDRMSAFLGSVPGLLIQVVILGTQYKSDLRGIVVVQTVRVLILAVAVPICMHVLGLASTPPPPPPLNLASSWPELLLLVGASTVTAIAFTYAGIPGAPLFGAMAASVILHGSGIVHVALPFWFTAAAICCLGAISGSRFANTGPRLLLKYISAAFGSFVVANCTAAIFIVLLVWLFSFPVANVIVAFSPGGLDVMMILALSMHLDLVYVGAHHVARFILISIMMPFAIRFIVGQDAKPTE